MLTAAQFQQWCLRLRLPPATIELLAQRRAALPMRHVRSQANNVSGTYASRKMGCTIQFESHKVELWAIYTMEYDSRVLEYYDQPLTLELHSLTQAGAWLEEWKQESRLLELALTQPYRYQRDDQGHWRCPPGEEAASPLGLHYRVR